MTAGTCDLNTDARLRDLVEHCETPCYVYDLGYLRRRIAEIRAAFQAPGFTLLFATMANDNPSLLRAIAAERVGACVNSVRHLCLVLECGFKPDRIQFTSTGLSRRDMEELLTLGVAVNLDSPLQAERWVAELGGRRMGLRVNAASLLREGMGDRIGMDAAILPAVHADVEARGGIVVGLHVYVGTNFQQPEEMLPTLQAYFQAAAGIPGLEYVNIGGGIGVDYLHFGGGFDLMRFGAEVSTLTDDLSRVLRRPIRLLFEPGRGLIASSGVLLTRVTDIKLLRGTTYVAVDASIAVFPRPFHHPESPHRVRKLGANGDARGSERVTVVGRTTFSRDILAQTEILASLQVDDILVFEDAGAYCQSMMSRFLGQNDPTVISFEE